MNPNVSQSSTDCLLSGNTPRCPGFPLPRSFTLAYHESVGYGAFSILSTVLSPGKSFTHASYEKQVYGFPSNLSIYHSRTLNLGLFGLTSVRGNSRALVLAIVRGNQTRILFVWDFIWAVFESFIAARQTKVKLGVAYTVIRPHSAMRCTFALTSDYLEDLYSFYFTEKGALCTQFMDEFTSRSAHLNTASNEEKNKEGLGC